MLEATEALIYNSVCWEESGISGLFPPICWLQGRLTKAAFLPKFYWESAPPIPSEPGVAFGFHAGTHPVSQVNDWKKASQVPSFPVHKSHIRSQKGWEGEREGSADLGALESHQQFHPGGTDSTLGGSIIPQPLLLLPLPAWDLLDQLHYGRGLGTGLGVRDVCL